MVPTNEFIGTSNVIPYSVANHQMAVMMPMVDAAMRIASAILLAILLPLFCYRVTR